MDEEIIESFTSFLSTTQDLGTLEHFQKLVNDRIEVVSNSNVDSVTEDIPDIEDVVTKINYPGNNLKDFVNIRENYPLPYNLEGNLFQELHNYLNIGAIVNLLSNTNGLTPLAQNILLDYVHFMPNVYRHTLPSVSSWQF